MQELREGLFDRTPRTLEAVTRGMREGLHVGAQVYASLQGNVVADFAIGVARAGVPMRTDTLMLWMSATKPVAAVAIAQLWEKSLLKLDDRVSRHIPEFATRGKEPITIRHLLTHTGGFRGIAGKWEENQWDTIIATVCDARLEPDWVPGRKAGYHLATSWYILGELVRWLDPQKRPFERYVRDEIFLPLGMTDSWVGLPPDQFRNYGTRIGLMHDTTGETPRPDHPYDTEQGAAACRPGSNGRGPVRQLGFFYEALLNGGARNGRQVLTPQTVEALTAGHRIGLYDHTFRHVMDWGLGFLLNSARYGESTVPYGHGTHASPRTYGHGGSQCCSAFADPEHGLAAAILCNGRPGEARHDQRMRQIHAALYEDLGLTG